MGFVARHKQDQNEHYKRQRSFHSPALLFCCKQARLLSYYRNLFNFHSSMVLWQICLFWLVILHLSSCYIPRSVPTINLVGIVGSNSRHDTPCAFWISLHSFSGSRISTSVGSVNFRISHHFTLNINRLVQVHFISKIANVYIKKFANKPLAYIQHIFIG